MAQKPKVDPGWNDPPMLSYTAMNPPPKSRITNKRVAFPISSNSSTTPPEMFESSNPIPSLPPMVVPESAEVLFPQGTKENICRFLKSAEANEHFSRIWEDGKLSDECKQDVELLADALIESDEFSVQRIRDKLVSQYKDLCETWINDITL